MERTKREDPARSVPAFRCRTIVMAGLLLACGFPLASDEGGSYEYSPTRERFSIAIAGFWPELSTRIRLDAADGQVGTEIDLEEDLDLDGRQAVPMIGIQWRMKGPHHLSLGYYDLDRDSRTQLKGEIRYGDEVFPVSDQVRSGMRTQVLFIYYAYNFLHRKERAGFGLGGGFHITDLDAFIESEVTQVQEETSATAPLPMIGLFGGYAFSNKWAFWGRAQVFYLDLGDYRGSLGNIAAEVQYNPFRYVGFGFGYYMFDLEIHAGSDALDGKVDLDGKLRYNYHGPVLLVRFRF